MRLRGKKLLAVLTGLSISFLGGCGNDSHDDVKEWMRESSKDLRGHVPELPQIKQLDVKPYEPGDLIPPFAVEKVVSGGLAGARLTSKQGGPNPINPDAYPLTKVPLETIRFVGTILVDKEVRALMQVEREPIRQVRVGDYIGQNYGRVQKVEASSNDLSGHIVLKEKLLDKGIWVERDTVFPAQDKGERK